MSEVADVAERLARAAAALATVTPGAVYRDQRTGWVGQAMVPSVDKVFFPPKDGRPKIGLRGPSGKDDRGDEIRMAFFDDLEPATGELTGFGG